MLKYILVLKIHFSCHIDYDFMNLVKQESKGSESDQEAPIGEFKVGNGNPLPLGVSLESDGINFSTVLLEEGPLVLHIFNLDNQLIARIALDTQHNRTGQTWHIKVHDLKPPFYYAYSLASASNLLLDPYAKAVNTRNLWDDRSLPTEYQPLGVFFQTDDPFDWDHVASPGHDLKDLIIYEMHIRGFTKLAEDTKYPGKFLGVLDKIPYLLDLGVNAVEFLPIHEFNEAENVRICPKTNRPLWNYWGYSTVNFFSLMNRYVVSEQPGAGIQEFKTLVRELHRKGIEVILDVVFNHTAEGNGNGPTLSFKGFGANTYYIVDEKGNYANYTGCGNTVRCQHPIVRELIKNCLRYWVTEFHVDGFRFDLASILTRDEDGKPLEFPPLIDEISRDPVLANTKMIAEAWDPGGLYQVGGFYTRSPRWSEWNGKYRDSAREFIKGTIAKKGEFVTRICGSEDLYENRGPQASINFITSHDGYSLHDLVSYQQKHNELNGEENRDGDNNNHSWNCGAEGTTDNSEIIALRERQKCNFIFTLMISQGVPMIHMGDEYGHTRNGNNNGWCQDSGINWFLWDEIEKNAAYHRFFKKMVHFRKNHPLLRLGRFLNDNDIEWHGFELLKPNWDKSSHFIAFTLKDPENKNDLHIAFNSFSHEVNIEFPEHSGKTTWHWIVNTANPSPQDYYDENEAPPLSDKFYEMRPYSALLLKGIKT